MNYDEHWQPIALLCGLCDVRYDIVIKTEDMPETTSILLNKLSLENNHPAFPHENKMEKVQISQFYQNISRSKVRFVNVILKAPKTKAYCSSGSFQWV